LADHARRTFACWLGLRSAASVISLRLLGSSASPEARFARADEMRRVRLGSATPISAREALAPDGHDEPPAVPGDPRLSW